MNEVEFLVASLALTLLIGSVLIWGIAKCWAVSRRPGTNTKCVVALMLILISYFVSVMSNLLPRFIPFGFPVDFVGSFVSFAISMAGVVLAIVGLREYSQRRGVYKRGRAQAIWTLSIGGIFIVLVLAIAVAERRGSFPSKVVGSPLAGRPLVFEELNFQFAHPGGSWVKVETNSLDRDAMLAFERTRPEAHYVVIARTAPHADYSSDELADVATENLRKIAKDARMVFRGNTWIGGWQGLRLDSHAEQSGEKYYYQHRLFARNGWTYQLIAWGRSRDEPTVAQEANILGWRFQLLDPLREANSKTNSSTSTGAPR